MSRKGTLAGYPLTQPTGRTKHKFIRKAWACRRKKQGRKCTAHLRRRRRNRRAGFDAASSRRTRQLRNRASHTPTSPTR